MRINADGIYYRQLNEQIHAALAGGAKDVTLGNIRGQRYLGTGLGKGVCLAINGIPGNDLGIFMNGAEIIVNGNAQDGVGNTMNDGKIVIRGDAGDILGYSQRGGKIFVQGSVGYRAGIHMKAYEGCLPVVVIGQTTKDYLGEYMAGGILAVLNLDSVNPSPVGEFVGTGMHGGIIYLRGQAEPYQLGREVKISQLNDSDWSALSETLGEYCRDFDLNPSDFCCDDFVKLTPRSSRPYGRLYAY